MAVTVLKSVEEPVALMHAVMEGEAVMVPVAVTLPGVGVALVEAEGERECVCVAETERLGAWVDWGVPEAEEVTVPEPHAVLLGVAVEQEDREEVGVVVVLPVAQALEVDVWLAVLRDV